MNYAISLVSGIGFGFALEKSRVTEKSVIQNQMIMKDMRMMKIFLSAAGTSGIMFSLLQLVGSKFFKLRLSDTLLLSNSLGGITLGIGMFFSAGCPGTFLAQIGAGKTLGFVGMLGGIAGALTFSFLQPKITQFLKIGDLGRLTVTTKENFWKFGLSFGGAMLLISVILEVIFRKPPKIDTDTKPDFKNGTVQSYLHASPLGKKEWSQIASGVLLGSMQVPMLLASNSALGHATQYVTLSTSLLSMIYPSILSNKHVEGVLAKPNGVIKVFKSIGTFLGGYISSSISGTREENKKKSITAKEVAVTFIGGFLVLFGARMAQGCNSGHGISGMSSGSVSSFIATAATFAGAIGTGVILYLFKGKGKSD